MYLRKSPNMKLWLLKISLIQLNTYLPYFWPDCPGQLVISLPDDDIKAISHYANYVEKEYDRTGIQLLRWSNPLYGRIL